jgi:hypothetical protein
LFGSNGSFDPDACPWASGDLHAAVENITNDIAIIQVDNGAASANSGWTTVEIGGVTYTRADMTHSYSAVSELNQWLITPSSGGFGVTDVDINWDP